MWNLSRPGIELVSPALACRFLSTEAPVKPYTIHKKQNCPPPGPITPSFSHKSHFLLGLISFWLVMIHLPFPSFKLFPIRASEWIFPLQSRPPVLGRLLPSAGIPGGTHMPHPGLEESEKGGTLKHRWSSGQLCLLSFEVSSQSY